MTVKTRCVVVAMALLAAGVVLAQEKSAPGDEQQSIMEAYQRAATPGPQHAMLATMAGEFTLTLRSFNEPGGEPVVSAGTSTRAMILGGRYLEETVKASVMGQPFEGRGLTGYDNVTRSWWGSWIDTMSTGIMITGGTWDEEAGVGTFEGEYNDPVTGELQSSRSVIRRLPNGDEIMEMYMTTAVGEVKAMEIVYQRK
jgi:Protein of unknown function (DUF1579)